MIEMTETALAEAAKNAGITPDQARTILEAIGVKVEPEKPALPTEPGSVVIATEVRGVTGKWRMMLDRDGDWFSAEAIDGDQWHAPKQITAWTEAVVLPATAAPFTLTKDQAGKVWDKGATSGDTLLWLEQPVANREGLTRFANAILAEHAAPAEGVQIDSNDVRKGDLVRLVVVSGEEITCTVTEVWPGGIESERYNFPFARIRTIHLLHREEA